MRVNKCTVKWREGGGRRKGTEEEWIMDGCMEGWMDGCMGEGQIYDAGYQL